MSLGLVGRKVGMMRIFTDDGDAVPVTVLDVSNNRVAQIKTVDTDGYSAVQVAYGERRATRVTKPEAGHFAKAGVQAGSDLREFRVAADKLGDLKPGAVIGVGLFAAGQKVDVHGTSIGKGFTGTIKRHNFGSGRASHGNSRSHNVPGSIGMAQDPGRVFPGKRMSGHMGDESKTVQNLVVADSDGHIGWTPIGRIPRRGAGYDPTVPSAWNRPPHSAGTSCLARISSSVARRARSPSARAAAGLRKISRASAALPAISPKPAPGRADGAMTAAITF